MPTPDNRKPLKLSQTQLSSSVQNQLLKLQLDIEIVTRSRFNISKSAYSVADLLAYAVSISNARLKRNYELLIDSLKSSEKLYLKQVLGCHWLVVLDDDSSIIEHDAFAEEVAAS